ncbi:ubiquitin carboxyl-terminal hydrolase MINDY-3 isoform X1 [Phyllostomus discolor]|uniref:Ubiquitin carboxyl-terminal hydrolase MINDY n=1 Tax=Phyllostomus discolor TaxID=89673 RepID=A0A7E6DLR2_9CHIR|nr:ubiquitin carboxyl-terminal hydrolase MINDY-3 isoform X1 [Phyllostomus discolor]
MSELTKELVELVWGTKSSPGLSDTIFCRWTQGFVFSESEGSALEQFEGGPCAVIAPVQAFLLKKLLFSSEKSSWRDCPEEERKELLCHTLCDILESACCDNSGSYCLVSWLKGKTTEETASISGSPAESSCQVEHSSSALAVEELGFERFHALIQKRSFRSLSELKDAVLDQYSMWGNKFGVLLFLYSVLLTKGIENIKNEIEDSTEPLIDPVYGHGSQSLINLLLTGHAVSNVWDGDRECSGMKLLGIHEQAAVGFLTLMEALRYCKVGSYLKSPKFPIWIVGSETHLTVFFAKDMALVAPEAPSEQARRVFQTYDPEVLYVNLAGLQVELRRKQVKLVQLSQKRNSHLQWFENVTVKCLAPDSSQAVSRPLLVPDVCFLLEAPSLARAPAKRDPTGFSPSGAPLYSERTPSPVLLSVKSSSDFCRMMGWFSFPGNDKLTALCSLPCIAKPLH